MGIRKRVIIELGWAYLGTILMFVDYVKGSLVLNKFFVGLDWISHLGGII